MKNSLDIINNLELKVAEGSYSNQTFTFFKNGKNYYIFINKFGDKQKIKRQLAMTEILKSNNISVPKIIQNQLISYEKKLTEVIITEEIEGINLGSLIIDNKIKVDEAFYLMGKFLKKIHSIDNFRNFGYIENNIFKNWKILLKKLVDSWLYFCANNTESLSNAKYNKIQEYLYSLIMQLPDKEYSVILHGDYYPNNIIYSELQKKIVGVLDFEWAMYGDPIYDFRVMEFFLFPEHKDKSSFYKGYNIDINNIELELSIYKEIYKLELAYMISLTDQERLKEAEDYLKDLYSRTEET